MPEQTRGVSLGRDLEPLFRKPGLSRSAHLQGRCMAGRMSGLMWSCFLVCKLDAAYCSACWSEQAKPCPVHRNKGSLPSSYTSSPPLAEATSGDKLQAEHVRLMLLSGRIHAGYEKATDTAGLDPEQSMTRTSKEHSCWTEQAQDQEGQGRGCHSRGLCHS